MGGLPKFTAGTRMGRGRRRLLWLLVAACGLGWRAHASAQSTTSNFTDDGDATALNKQTQNPVANLTSVPLQFNFFSGGGLGGQTQSLVNFQPVLPLPITKDWNVITRPIFPIINTPLPNEKRKLGLGDLQLQLFVTPAKTEKLVWGVGPVASFPTATNDTVATGQWGLGPAAVLLVTTGPWVTGFLVHNVWKIAGSDQNPKLNTFTLQPFVNFNFTRGWALVFTPLITAKWSAKKGNEWTVPLGLGISKVHNIGAQAVQMSLQYYRNVVYQEGAGANQVRIVFSFLFPNAPPAPPPPRPAP